MNTLEDRIRAATTQTAEEIAPGSIAPLSLAKVQRRRPGPAVPARGRAGWPRVLVPLAAAASVVAVVAASLALTRPTHPPASHSTRHLAAGAVTLGAAPAYDRSIVPPYYVALEPVPLSGSSTRAMVRATATGAELAVVTPPRPYRVFTAVSAAADDRTFVLGAQRSGSGSTGQPGLEKYFKLRLDPADHTAMLTALPIPEEPGDQVVGIAIAPDGSKLAVALEPSGQREQEIKVISLLTGRARTWKGSSGNTDYMGAVVLGANPLSWTADGRTLAFEEETGSSGSGNPGHEIRLLNTAAPGGSLWSSRVAMRFGSDAADSMITPDGSKIVVPVITQTTREFAEYSVTTGKRVAVLGIRHYRHANYGGWPLLFWANSAGNTLIVYDDRPHGPQLTKTGEPDAGVLAVVTGSRFTPLPGADEQAAW